MINTYDTCAWVCMRWVYSLSSGDLSKIRRCRSLNDIQDQIAFHRLKEQLKNTSFNNWDGIAMVVYLLCSIKLKNFTDIEQEESFNSYYVPGSWSFNFGRVLANDQSGSPKPPLIQPIRFQRLIASKSHDDLFENMRPIIKKFLRNIVSQMNQGTTKDTGAVKQLLFLNSLINDLYFWNQKSRRSWALDYLTSENIKPLMTRPKTR